MYVACNIISGKTFKPQVVGIKSPNNFLFSDFAFETKLCNVPTTGLYTIG